MTRATGASGNKPEGVGQYSPGSCWFVLLDWCACMRKTMHGQQWAKKIGQLLPAHIMLEVMRPLYTDVLLQDVRFWLGTLTTWSEGGYHHQS